VHFNFMVVFKKIDFRIVTLVCMYDGSLIQILKDEMVDSCFSVDLTQVPFVGNVLHAFCLCNVLIFF